jgi:hypothetical protein
MRLLRRTALLIALILLASQTTQATTLLQGYTDLPDWQAAATTTGEETFESLTAGKTYNTSAGYTDALGIDFVGAFASGSPFNLEVVSGALSQWDNFGTGNVLDSGYSSSYQQPILAVGLPANITAIAVDVMSSGNTWPVTITAGDATTEATVTVNTASLQETFYGFTFSAPISWVDVTVLGSPAGTSVLLDNFCIGAADVSDPVPEPATLLLIGLGLVCMACLRKRKPA